MSDSLSTLRDLSTRTEFHTGIVLGVIALSLLAVAARVNAPGRARPWGLATAAATLIGVELVDDLRLGLAGGVALMAVGGALVGPEFRIPTVRHVARQGSCVRSDRLRLVGWPIIAAGALMIPWRGQVDEDDWFFVASPIVAVAVGWAFSTWTRSVHLRGLGALFAITTFAVWTTVPDTDLARLLLGVSLPLGLATSPPMSARVTGAGAFALAGVFAWIPALGGESRPASIIGAWACIGMIAIVPIANEVWPARRPVGTTTVFVIHTVLVLIAARVIGLGTSAVPAAIAAVFLYAGTLLLVHGLDRRSLASDRAAGRR